MYLIGYGGNMLSGSEIIKQVLLGRIRIDPFNIENVGPNSYDLTITNKLVVYDENVLDPRRKDLKTKEIIIPDNGYILQPGHFYLGSTVESTGSSHFVPMLHGRSSAARLGICAHIAAGLGDLGWYGQWTLEMVVPIPVLIYPNMRMCQVTFESVSGLVTRYSGKYQDQKDPTPSKIWMDNLRKPQSTQIPLLVEDEIMASIIDVCSVGTKQAAYIPWDKRYCVTDMGDVISLIGVPKKLSEFTRKESPYKLVQIAGRTKIYVHRLVAAAFLGSPSFNGEIHIVRHKDDNYIDNRPSNLVYGTNQDNADDAKKNGRIHYGSDNHNAILNEDKVRLIRQTRFNHKSRLVDLAKQFNVNQETIRRILQRKAWVHIDDGLGNLCSAPHKIYELSTTQKSEIDQRLLNGESRKSLAKEYGVPVRVIHHRASRIIDAID